MKKMIAIVTMTIIFCFVLGTRLMDQSDAMMTLPTRTSGAGQALDAWSYERCYPDSKINMSAFSEAFDLHQKYKKTHARSDEPQWEALGPPNVAGRTLCLAFHPVDSQVIFAGSASGGLWKTETQGLGPNAWSYVATGFPILGVAAIAIDPKEHNTIYIGTGEVYNSFQLAEPGEVNRLTRGTYGIGILKSVDGGLSWTHVLDWSASDIRGIQDLEINPHNTSEIYAATTEGLLKSIDSGGSWVNIHSPSLAVDVELDPTQDSVVYVSHGNLNLGLNSIQVGLYKSEDGGQNFTKLNGGLPGNWSGKAHLSIHPIHPNIIYASIQAMILASSEATTPVGLYKSSDFGVTWRRQNNVNVAIFQGWYSHDVALNPLDTNELYYVGIDTWHSTDGGLNIRKISDWSKAVFGPYPTTGPDGPPDHVHADIHAAYFSPHQDHTIFLATDGGVFTTGGDENFISRNEGMQTTQFYANMANSTSDSMMVMAGAQDNATYLRDRGQWLRLIGGDGMSAAIDPSDDNIIYGSAQGLFMVRSLTRGDSFDIIRPPLQQNEFSAFSAPYELAPNDPAVIYAGARWLYRSRDRGTTWDTLGTAPIDPSNVITSIAISPRDAKTIIVATSSNPLAVTQSPKVFQTKNEGNSWHQIQDLPNRVAKDIVFDPIDPDKIYISFSGFGSSHLYKSEDEGQTWNAAGFGLPDVPTHGIAIDPEIPNNIYVGNDLGVYFSSDGAENWEVLANGLPDAVIAMHLDISLPSRKLRVATHGHGIYERDLQDAAVVSTHELTLLASTQIYPNPVSDELNIIWESSNYESLTCTILSLAGQIITQKEYSTNTSATLQRWNIQELQSGIYIVQFRTKNHFSSKKLIKL